MISLMTSCSSEKEARKIAFFLIKKKLAACAVYHKINSIYMWRGKMESGNEWFLTAKTTAAKSKKAEKAIKKIHSHNIPFILKQKEKANKEYEAWLKRELK